MNIPKDYKTGIKNFSVIIKEKPETIEPYLEKYNMFLKILFQEYSDNYFMLTIANNSTIGKDELIITEDSLKETDLSRKERKRIIQKLEYFKQIKDDDKLIELMSKIDEEEGSGLGLMLSLKMLEKVGIKSNALTYELNDFMTIAKIMFRYDEVSPSPYSIIAQSLLKEVEGFPEFPENVKSILEKLNKDNVTVGDVVEDISRDPSLTADVLKLVNSAKFMLNRKIGSVREAVNFIGVKGLKNVIYSCTAINTINKKYGTAQEIWNHAYKTAKICSQIARLKNLDKKDDEFFTAGLLHDIGKIVIISFDKEKTNKIENICHEKGIQLQLIEDIFMGINHAKIGGKIAEYWNFPPGLVASIMYHHDPSLALSNKELVYSVYLANEFANQKSFLQYDFHQIEQCVREFFAINSQEKLINLLNTLQLV